MEKVRFSCPRCRTMMQTGVEKVGYDVACPNCAHRFKLVESPGSSASQIEDKTLPPQSSPFSANTNVPQASPPAPEIPAASAKGGMSHAAASIVPAPTIQQHAFACPYCQSKAPPHWKSEVSTVGWIVFAVLLVSTCVGCVVGLFIRDKFRVCSQCKIRLG